MKLEEIKRLCDEATDKKPWAELSLREQIALAEAKGRLEGDSPAHRGRNALGL